MQLSNCYASIPGTLTRIVIRESLTQTDVGYFNDLIMMTSSNHCSTLYVSVKVTLGTIYLLVTDQRPMCDGWTGQIV